MIPTLQSSSNKQLPKKFNDFQLNIPPSLLFGSSSFNMYFKNVLSYMAPNYLHSLAHVLTALEPNTYNQAKDHPKWMEVMQKANNAMEKTKTLDLTSLPPEKKAIPSRYVYKAKFNYDGSIERCKERIVARGDKHVEGSDYKHTFSHVAKFTIVMEVIAWQHFWLGHTAS